MSNSSLTEGARQAQRNYQNKWRAANKNKVKEYNQRYWEKKASELAVSKQSEASNGDKKN